MMGLGVFLVLGLCAACHGQTLRAGGKAEGSIPLQCSNDYYILIRNATYSVPSNIFNVKIAVIGLCQGRTRCDLDPSKYKTGPFWKYASYYLGPESPDRNAPAVISVDYTCSPPTNWADLTYAIAAPGENNTLTCNSVTRVILYNSYTGYGEFMEETTTAIEGLCSQKPGVSCTYQVNRKLFQNDGFNIVAYHCCLSSLSGDKTRISTYKKLDVANLTCTTDLGADRYLAIGWAYFGSGIRQSDVTVAIRGACHNVKNCSVLVNGETFGYMVEGDAVLTVGYACNIRSWNDVSYVVTKHDQIGTIDCGDQYIIVAEAFYGFGYQQHDVTANHIWDRCEHKGWQSPYGYPNTICTFAARDVTFGDTIRNAQLTVGYYCNWQAKVDLPKGFDSRYGSPRYNSYMRLEAGDDRATSHMFSRPYGMCETYVQQAVGFPPGSNPPAPTNQKPSAVTTTTVKPGSVSTSSPTKEACMAAQGQCSAAQCSSSSNQGSAQAGGLIGGVIGNANVAPNVCPSICVQCISLGILNFKPSNPTANSQICSAAQSQCSAANCTTKNNQGTAQGGLLAAGVVGNLNVAPNVCPAICVQCIDLGLLSSTQPTKESCSAAKSNCSSAQCSTSNNQGTAQGGGLIGGVVGNANVNPSVCPSLCVQCVSLGLLDLSSPTANPKSCSEAQSQCSAANCTTKNNQGSAQGGLLAGGVVGNLNAAPSVCPAICVQCVDLGLLSSIQPTKESCSAAKSNCSSAQCSTSNNQGSAQAGGLVGGVLGNANVNPNVCPSLCVQCISLGLLDLGSNSKPTKESCNAASCSAARCSSSNNQGTGQAGGLIGGVVGNLNVSPNVCPPLCVQCISLGILNLG